MLGLSTLPAPAHVGDKLARQTGFAGAEFKTYKLTVRLVAWKLSDKDSDIHLEVRGLVAPQTMVVEFPLASCIAKSANTTKRQKMAVAKTALLAACGKTHQPTTTMRKLSGTATITGVGIFDKSLGQGGGADNGIELTPCSASQATTASPRPNRWYRRIARARRAASSPRRT